MKPVVTRLYALFVALALLGFVVWSVADWMQTRDGARAQAQAQLRHAAGALSDLTIRAKPLDSATLGPVITSFVGHDPRWKMVLLTSPERGTEYYRGPRPPLDPSQAVPAWRPQPLTETAITLPVFRAGQEPLTLQAIYEFYGSAQEFLWFRALGITLLTLLVLTTLVVLLSLRTSEPETSPDEPEIRARPDVEPRHQTPVFDEPPPPVTPEPVRAIDDSAEADDEYWFDEDQGLPDLPPLEPLSEEFSAALPDAAHVSGPEPEAVAWPERRLDESLSQFLNDSDKNEHDVAVLSISAATSNSAWTGAIHEFFSEEGTSFDRERGVTVLLPDRSLEDALTVARTLVETVERRNSGISLHVGASSRNGRDVEADVLLAEADSARRRSLAGTVRVVGLKSDPERYQQHLAALAAGHHLYNS